jgi:hypothetical protein
MKKALLEGEPSNRICGRFRSTDGDPRMNETTTAQRIARTSRLMAVLTLAVAVLLPAVVVAYWLFASRAGLARQGQLPSASLLVLDLPHRLMAAAISLVPVLVFCSGLLRLRRCFLGVASGAYFTPATLAGFRDFGLGLLGMAVVSIPAGSLLTLMFSGGRQLNFSVSLGTLLLLSVAAAVSIVGWTLKEAADLKAGADPAPSPRGEGDHSKA